MRCLLVAIVMLGCGGPQKPPPLPAPSDALHVAIWAGDYATAQRLVAAGADINAPDAHEVPPWMYAVLSHDPQMLELLHGKLTGQALYEHVAMGIAVASNDLAILRTLLANGFPSETTLNATPLLVIAAANGRPDVMAMLLDHGAAVGARDLAGDTALVAAQRAGCTACIELLRRHGAETAPETVTEDHEPVLLRDAVTRSVPLLVAEGAHWVDEPGCPACHHQPMAIQVIAAAEQRGIALDATQVKKLHDFVHKDNAEFSSSIVPHVNDKDEMLRTSMQVVGDFAFGNAWFLSAEIDAGLPRGRDEQIAAQFEAIIQRPDGHWRHGPTRGALQSSDLIATALAARVIATYVPSAATDQRVDAARRWLIAATPATVLERVYKLNGLAWTHAQPSVVTAAAHELRAAQLPDGSWSHIGTVGDAMTTGLALVALHRSAGMSPTDPVYQRGVTYLLRTQQADGSWFVPSRAAPLLEYFDAGFPHGKHQFVSFVGTAAAALALMDAMAITDTPR